jgi:hypothetical protein
MNAIAKARFLGDDDVRESADHILRDDNTVNAITEVRWHASDLHCGYDLCESCKRVIDTRINDLESLWKTAVNISAEHRDTVLAQKRALDAIRSLHRPFSVYEFCGHQHSHEDPDVRYIDDIGCVCEDGLMYDICRACCCGSSDDDDHIEQPESCVDHGHVKGEPVCETVRILTTLEQPERAK